MLKRKWFSYGLILTLTFFSSSIFAGSPASSAAFDKAPQAKGLIIKYKDQSLAESAMQFGGMSQQVQAMLSDLSSQTGFAFTHERILSTGSQLVSLNDKTLDVDFLLEIAGMIQQDSRVQYVEPNLIMHAMATPNDSRYNEQWHYYENTGGLNLPTAWDIATGSGVVVAVVDTGYVSHSDLAANILPGYDMISDSSAARDGNGRDSNPADEGDWRKAGACGTNNPPNDRNSSWHGTHVAGTIAAVTNNNKGVAGVAYNAKILPVRVLGKCGGTLADIADGVVWAAGGNVSGIATNKNPAQVINLSLGGSGSCSNTYQTAFNTARNLGATIVVAAGNENQNTSNVQPANCNNVITVAGTDRQGNKADFGNGYGSNYGTHVDVAAPGGETATASNGILSTLNTGTTTPGSETYKFFQGTSMATPHVAGVVALLYQLKSSITPSEVEKILEDTARSFPGSCSQCGSGIVDAKAAVDAVNGGPGPDPTDKELKNGTAVSVTANKGEWKHYFVNVPSGASNLVIKSTGTSGDADLYTRFGSQPTSSSWDCRPYKGGSTESCPAIASPKVGKYHVSLYAYDAFSGVNLVASYDTGTNPDPTFNLSVTKSGQGSVALNPAGGQYNQGTKVTLTATASSGWTFSGWSGDLSGSTNPASITMNANKNVTATFTESNQPNQKSCEGRCGNSSADGSCWCDSSCASYGDCCADKTQFCGF